MSDKQKSLDAVEAKIEKLRETNANPDKLHRLQLKRERLQRSQYLAALRAARK